MLISEYSKRVTTRNNVGNLVLDIQRTLLYSTTKIVGLSSGNPLIFSQLVRVLKREAANIVSSQTFDKAICQYGDILVNQNLKQSILKLLKHNKVNLDEHDVIVTPGAMAVIFYVTNTFAGIMTENQKKKVLLAQCPDFADYSKMGLPDSCYYSIKPEVKITGAHSFKYDVDLDKVDFDDVSMVLLSRPCNPSGYIMSNEELEKLSAKVKQNNAIVVIDSAYSAPFPDLIFQEDFRLLSGNNVINIMSLSKAGLPGGRIGIIVCPTKFLSLLKTSS